MGTAKPSLDCATAPAIAPNECECVYETVGNVRGAEACVDKTQLFSGRNQIRIAFSHFHSYVPRRMSGSEENIISLTNYRWPFFAGLFGVLWVLFAVLWMMWGANQTRKEKEQRRQLDAFGNQLNQIDQQKNYE